MSTETHGWEPEMAMKWEAIENGKRWAIFLVDPLGATHILSVSTTAFNQEGIARLAAAAPDMLEALKEARELLRESGWVVTTSISRAIAKAEGAQ